MPRLKLRSPIPKIFHRFRKYCLITQLYGENPNLSFRDRSTGKMVRVYGPQGHDGIDFKTRFTMKYLFHRFFGNKAEKNVYRKNGNIPILAAHDGYLSMGYNDNYREGIYMKVRTEEFLEVKTPVQYETLYFHLSKVRVWKDDEQTTSYELEKGTDFVKAGTVLGWGGNSGRFTTGPHLHFELRRRAKKGGKWSKWEKIDPMPYFRDNVVYQRGYFPFRYFYKGKEISAFEAKEV